MHVHATRQVVEECRYSSYVQQLRGDRYLMGMTYRPGTHITAVGTFVPEKREVDTTTIRRANRIVVDSQEDCLEEAGDLIIPNAKINAEIGEIINGNKSARHSDDEITFFKSVGVAVQDAVAASVVLREAEAKGFGYIIDMAK